MHLVNVLSFGSKNFNTSLEELKAHLDFKLILIDKLKEEEIKDYDILIFHQDCLKIDSVKKILQESKQIKILVSNNTVKQKDYFNDVIPLPLKLSELNSIVENLVAKKNFNKNSSILLTEKEIQLLELLLLYRKPLSKNEILSEVWKYSEEADTHTVETHIYRLRKKIKSKFSDENFILNDKSGYLL